MRKFFAAAAVAATVMTGAVVSAQAAVTSAPVITPADTSFKGTSPTGGALSATFDYFQFGIPFGGSYTISANLTAGSPVTLLAFNIYQGTLATGPTGAAVATGSQLAPGFFRIGDTPLAAGSYLLGISAKGGVVGSNGYGGGIYTVNTVPLPNSIAMLGVAVAAVGIGGALSRKKKAHSAA